MKLNSNIKGVKVKPIPNYPEYLASFDGRVYSTKLHIKAEYLKGNTTLQKLSRKYGRAHSVIRRIVYETK